MFGWCLCHLRRQVAKIDWVSPGKIGLALRHVFLGGEGKNKNRFTKWIFVLEHGDDTWSLNWWHSSLTSLIQSGNHKWHLHLWRLHPGWSVAIELKVMFKCYKDLQEPWKLRKDLTYSTLHPSKATSTKDLIFINKGLLITLVPQQASPMDGWCQLPRYIFLKRRLHPILCTCLSGMVEGALDGRVKKLWWFTKQEIATSEFATLDML